MKKLHYVTYKMQTHENQGSRHTSLVITQPVTHRLEYCLFRLGTRIRDTTNRYFAKTVHVIPESMYLQFWILSENRFYVT